MSIPTFLKKIFQNKTKELQLNLFPFNKNDSLFIKYTTSEHLTGRLHTDGKPTYSVVLLIPGPPQINIDYSNDIQYLNIDTVISFKCMFYSPIAQLHIPMQAITAQHELLIASIYQKKNIIHHVTSSDWINCETVNILEYTKTTD